MDRAIRLVYPLSFCTLYSSSNPINKNLTGCSTTGVKDNIRRQIQTPVQWNSSISETVRNRTHVHIHFFCLEWPILWSPRILTFPPGTHCICSYLVLCYFVIVLGFLGRIPIYCFYPYRLFQLPSDFYLFCTISSLSYCVLYLCCFFQGRLYYLKMIKQTLYRPGHVLRAPAGWGTFLIRGWFDSRTMVRPEKWSQWKISNDSFENRRRDLLACSAVPR